MTRHHLAAAAIVRSILNGEWTNDPPDWADSSRVMHNLDLETMTAGMVETRYTRAVQTAEAFITLFTGSNPRFNRDRFLTACGLKEK